MHNLTVYKLNTNKLLGAPVSKALYLTDLNSNPQPAFLTILIFLSVFFGAVLWGLSLANLAALQDTILQ